MNRLPLLALVVLGACGMTVPRLQAFNSGITESEWHGYRRLDFVVEGRPALLICPAQPAPGHPWVWRAEWFGDRHAPQASLALLARGWYLAYMNATDLYGAPPAMRLFDAYYRRVTADYGLAKKVVIEGVSRGGLYAVNFAAQYPERVLALYLDAPTLNLESWPGRASPLWAECLASYGLTDAQFAAAKVSPMDRIPALVAARIPIIGVSGDADEVVSFPANLAKFAERYRAAGGHIEVIVKPGAKHHPHSLTDPTPIVDFMLKAWDAGANRK
ncbi:MAG: prolyl oligopeptidase family serine peptidase [Verrucomicrobia bacterium]|nr:prolyl oligopeptidase family serine peptidase [Verrucomicrobiota bacterium]